MLLEEKHIILWVKIMIIINKKGDFKKANSYFEKLLEIFHKGILDKYGNLGVEILREATPKETGETANSWYYEISHSATKATVTWYNSHINEGYCIAVLLQYGHGTGSGGYVEGTDYINPAMKKVFEELADEAWKEITSL